MELKWASTCSQVSASAGSNRTFMELKWRRTAHDGRNSRRSNRTFMELKSARLPLLLAALREF